MAGEGDSFPQLYPDRSLGSVGKNGEPGEAPPAGEQFRSSADSPGPSGAAATVQKQDEVQCWEVGVKRGPVRQAQTSGSSPAPG